MMLLVQENLLLVVVDIDTWEISSVAKSRDENQEMIIKSWKSRDEIQELKFKRVAIWDGIIS